MNGRAEVCFDIRNFSLSYGDRKVLHPFSWKIMRGGVTAILGPSGCGKSSLLTSFNRLTDLLPNCVPSGQIFFESQPILDRKSDPLWLRRSIGMIFQKPNPFPMTIRKNIEFPLRSNGMVKRGAVDAYIEEVLTRVGLWEEVKDRLHLPAMRLSGGQQQRLCIARALALRPRVLLLDEPCSALDPVSTATIEDLLRTLKKDMTLVIVTHNLSQARRIADRTAVFWYEEGAGTLVESGNTDDVFEHPSSLITEAYIRGARG